MRMCDLQLYVKIWNNITNTMLSERNQTQKSISHEIPLIKKFKSKQKKSMVLEFRIVVTPKGSGSYYNEAKIRGLCC